MLPFKFSTLINEHPLYWKSAFDGDPRLIFKATRTNPSNFDSYCVQCKMHSTFSHETNRPSELNIKLLGTQFDPNDFPGNYPFNEIFHCARNYGHTIIVSLLISGKTIEKIGQHPSMADIKFGDFVKYKKVIPQEFYQEITKAIGLFSHGVGVGSYVYLRRIFEYLIEEAHKEAEKSSTWSEEQYIKSRMNEKISLVSGNLPAFISENKEIYGMLSKGIHELSEEDCKKYFSVMLESIELILEQHEEIRMKKVREAKLKSEISKITSGV